MSAEIEYKYVRPKDIDNRSTPMQRLQWRLESIAWDLIYWWPVKALGPERGSGFTGWLFRKIGPLMSQHKTMLCNLRLAFPDRTEEDRKRIASAAWENVGRTAGELPHLSVIDPGNDKRVEVVGVEHLEAIAASGRGAVIVAGHFANWEVIAAVVCRRLDCLITYRALNNPYIDRKLSKARHDYGVRALAPKGIGTRELMRALSANRLVALMNDQKFNQGIPVPFFGYDAMTAPGPSRLALKYNVPVVPISVRRTGPVKFQVEIHQPFTPQQTGNTDADVQTCVKKITEFIETEVKQNPEQWFWQHRRWPKDVWKEAGVMDAPVTKTEKG